MGSILFGIGFVIIIVAFQVRKFGTHISGLDVIASNEREFNELLTVNKPAGIIEFPFDSNNKIKSEYSNEEFDFIYKKTLRENKLKKKSDGVWEEIGIEFIGKDSINIYGKELPLSQVVIGDKPKRLHSEEVIDESLDGKTKVEYYGVNGKEDTFLAMCRVLNGEIRDTNNIGNKIEIVGSSRDTYIKAHDKFFRNSLIIGILMMFSPFILLLIQTLIAFLSYKFGG